MHADRTNRFALALFGLLVLAAGAAGLTASLGGFGTAFSRRTLFANQVSAYIGQHGTWVWPAAAFVCLLIALAALRWMLALLISTDRAGDITIPGSKDHGTTILQPAALTGALAREIGTYHGVDAAKGRIIGDPHHPQIVLTVTAKQSRRPARPAPPHRNRSPRPRPAGTRQGRPAHPARTRRQPFCLANTAKLQSTEAVRRELRSCELDGPSRSGAAHAPAHCQAPRWSASCGPRQRADQLACGARLLDLVSGPARLEIIAG